MISTGSLRKQPIFFATPPQVSVRNNVWGTSVEIPYWWRVTYQIWELLLIVKANFPRGMTNQKHYPDPLSSTEAPAGYPYKNSNKRKKKESTRGTIVLRAPPHNYNTMRPLRRRKIQIWVVKRHQYKIIALVFQMSFLGETKDGVAKCLLFSQAKKGFVTLLVSCIPWSFWLCLIFKPGGTATPGPTVPPPLLASPWSGHSRIKANAAWLLMK